MTAKSPTKKRKEIWKIAFLFVNGVMVWIHTLKAKLWCNYFGKSYLTFLSVSVNKGLIKADTKPQKHLCGVVEVIIYSFPQILGKLSRTMRACDCAAATRHTLLN